MPASSYPVGPNRSGRPESGSSPRLASLRPVATVSGRHEWILRSDQGAVHHGQRASGRDRVHRRHLERQQLRVVPGGRTQWRVAVDKTQAWIGIVAEVRGQRVVGRRRERSPGSPRAGLRGRRRSRCQGRAVRPARRPAAGRCCARRPCAPAQRPANRRSVRGSTAAPARSAEAPPRSWRRAGLGAPAATGRSAPAAPARRRRARAAARP